MSRQQTAPDLVVCPSCRQLAPLGRWHRCCCGTYRQLAPGGPQAAVTALQLPRALTGAHGPPEGPEGPVAA